MKIYFHYSLKKMVNTYLITNEQTREAILIDPAKITPALLHHIENKHFHLRAVFITHNYPNHFTRPIKTLLTIYSPDIYGADPELPKEYSHYLRDDGIIQSAGFSIEYYTVPTTAPNAHIYKINHVIFTGNALLAGQLGETSNQYAARNLTATLEKKLLNQPSDTILMPAYGPPTSIAAELAYNPALHNSKTTNKKSIHCSKSNTMQSGDNT